MRSTCLKKRSLRCPKCRSLDTKRRGRRFIKTQEKIIIRLSCRSCGWTGPLSTSPLARHEDDVCAKIARESLERASIRILARRHKKSKTTIMKIVHDTLAALPGPAEIAKKLLPHWSGVFVFDGKVVRVYDDLTTKLDRSRFSDAELRWMHKMRWLAGIDYGTGDLPYYALAEAESRIELVMYFEKLRSLKYPLLALICDGNPEIPHAAKFVFGQGLVVQRCTRHFLEDLRALLPPEKEFPTERANLERIVSLVKGVIEADDIEAAATNETLLFAAVRSSKNVRARQMFVLYQNAKTELTAHLTHPELGLPHTSNDVESLFKQLMLRLKSLGRFFHHRYASDYLNAWALLRRFTIFTDCCRSRRHRNGKAPLELAGCEIKNIDPFKLRK